jgi:hypothetical protein
MICVLGPGRVHVDLDVVVLTSPRIYEKIDYSHSHSSETMRFHARGGGWEMELKSLEVGGNAGLRAGDYA